MLMKRLILFIYNFKLANIHKKSEHPKKEINKQICIKSKQSSLKQEDAEEAKFRFAVHKIFSIQWLGTISPFLLMLRMKRLILFIYNFKLANIHKKSEHPKKEINKQICIKSKQSSLKQEDAEEAKFRFAVHKIFSIQWLGTISPFLLILRMKRLILFIYNFKLAKIHKKLNIPKRKYINKIVSNLNKNIWKKFK